MNFFSSTGPSPEDVAEANIAKSKITDTLKLSIQSLQKIHVNSEEPIRSEDSANTVCSVVEALFLHGLKSSYTPKSYWPVISRVTHKDVIAQLNHLSQITTEVGMCRAWVRLALNDSILASYLDALAADKKILRNHYTRIAFLRDSEQIDILRALVQGLQCFTFNLAFNASVLNLWTSTPLVLAGLQQAPTHAFPAPVMARPVGHPPQETASSPLPAVAMSTASALPPIISSNTPSPPPNTPYAASQLTARDIDQIRQLTMVSRCTDDNSSTTASQVSHPDFSDSRVVHDLMPSLIHDMEEMKFQAILADTAPLHTPLSDSPVEVESIRKYRMKEEKMLHSEESAVYSTSFKSEQGSSSAAVTESPDDLRSRPNPVIVTKSNNQEMLGNMSDQVSSSYSEPEDLAHSCTGTNIEEMNPSEPLSMRKNSSVPKFTPVKSPPLKPELSDVVAVTAEIASEALTSHTPAESNMATYVDDSDADIYSTDEVKQGNSLDTSHGWSSHFDTENILPDVKLNMEVDEQEERLTSSMPESFDNLLHSYAPPSQQQEVSSLSELIRNLSPDSPRQSLPNEGKQKNVKEPKSARRTLPSDDSFDGDGFPEYEVLPDLVPGDKSYLNDPKFQPLLSLVGILCNERGLDMQNYQCKTCARAVGMFYGKARVCAFDGGYYCYECHENETYLIPSHIIFNWDFNKYQVSRRNFDFLHLIEDEPLFNINELNPSLYTHVPELDEIRRLRMQLRYLKTYLFSCSQHVADELRRQVWPREYLFDNIHTYSLNDLVRVTSGNLVHTIRQVIQFSTKHVYECRLCPLKGFICEICKNRKVIYPFQMDSTTRCERCKSVYHRGCISESTPCPKCTRFSARSYVNEAQHSSPHSQIYTSPF